MARRKDTPSAIPGNVGPNYDIAAVDSAYDRRVKVEMLNQEVRVEGTPADGVYWARKIIARIAAGEKLPIISIQFAKEALSEGRQEQLREREPGEDESERQNAV